MPNDENLGEVNSTVVNDGSQEWENPTKDPKELIERYKNQVKGSKAEALKLRDEKIEIAVTAVEHDAKYMKVLVAKDPKLADEVARRFDGIESAEDLMNKHLWLSSDNDKKLADMVTERVLAQLWQANLNTQVEQKFSHLWDDLKKVAQDKFDIFKWNRKLSPEQATDLADMITLSLQKDNIVQAAKQSKMNNLWNLKLWGVSVSHSSNDNSWQGLADALWFGYLYTNNK